MNNKYYSTNNRQNVKNKSVCYRYPLLPYIKFASTIFILITMILCAAEVEKQTSKPLPAISPLYQKNESGDSIILSWNLPAQKPDSVASYEVWYHTENNFNSVFIKNIPASSKPYAIIHRNEVTSTDSVFYFMVRSVLKSGEKSEYHISSDSSAVPASGWLLRWK
jgi:hypothetical protein